jgi:ABC-2 type transport system ATP-binding protein
MTDDSTNTQGDSQRTSETETQGAAVAMDRRTVLQATGATAVAATGMAGSAGASKLASVTKERFTVESWDGTELGATLYIPPERGEHPSVLMTHGWGAARISPLTVPKALNYAKNGYVVLTYDSRGFAESEGTVTLNGPNETKDAQYLIDWLANETGQYGVEVETDGADNPRVGMDGISYAGGIQYQVAVNDDRLDAMVPRITWNDLSYSLEPNGVIKIGWLSALLGLGELNTLIDPDAQVTEDLTDWYLEAVQTNEVPPAAREAFTQRSVAYKDEIGVPTLLMQGWNDSLFNPTEALDTYDKLQAEGTESRLLFYKGGHDLSEIGVSFENRDRMNNHALAWMDQHVRGEDTTVPQVTNWLTQRETWREDEQFPPADTSRESYALSNSGTGSARLEQWSWFHDDAVTYEWTVDEDIEVIGEPRIDLTLDVHGSEGIIFTELFHNGDNINGMDQPYRINGSGTYDISFEYPAIQEFLSAGDTVGLEVSVSNTWYFDSRESDGVTVRPAGSRLVLPQRPDDGGGETDSEEEEDEDCWLFC